MRAFVTIFLTAAGALLLIELIGVIIVEFSGYLDEDALIYFAVGRGILNGLTPYRDLFETKPPGIFLLTAASLLLGGAWFAKTVFVAALFAIPASILRVARQILRAVEGADRRILRLLAWLIALLLTLYTAYFSGGLQVELLGTAATCIYLALVAVHPAPWNRRRILIAAIPLFLAVFLKEPFVLSALGGALILAPSFTALLTVFLLPAIAAGLIFLSVLLISGWLLPYLGYLVFMLTYHTGFYNGPLLPRGFFVHRILENAWNYSPFLPILLIGLAAGTVMWGWTTHQDRRGRSLHIARIGAALYLTTLAVAAGGEFFAHHFIFAVPVYIALLVASLRWTAGLSPQARRRPLVLLACITIGIAFVHTRRLPLKQIDAWREHSAALRRAATTIDRVLDDCGVDRYLYLVSRGGGPFGYTRHSPLGPVFLNHNRLISTTDSPLWEGFQSTLEEAVIAVYRDRDSTGMTEEGWRHFQREFTADAPPCARGRAQPEPFRILFRREAVQLP